ncbi:MarR family transcriptional regulator [bacterium]|nr:MarR family transcriptional regulator [bacterium]
MATRYRGELKEVASLDVYIKLMRASTSVLNQVVPRLQKAGLTFSQFGVLEALYHLGPLCQKELGDKLLQSGGNITMVVNNLERQGLVVRLRDEIDKRYMVVHLTWRGTQRIQELFPLHLQDLVQSFQMLSEEELATLNDLLRKIGKG